MRVVNSEAHLVYLYTSCEQREDYPVSSESVDIPSEPQVGNHRSIMKAATDLLRSREVYIGSTSKAGTFWTDQLNHKPGHGIHPSNSAFSRRLAVELCVQIPDICSKDRWRHQYVYSRQRPTTSLNEMLSARASWPSRKRVKMLTTAVWHRQVFVRVC
nr:hypothetical protein CFP56_22359 [Quercus suber]